MSDPNVEAVARALWPTALSSMRPRRAHLFPIWNTRCERSKLYENVPAWELLSVDDAAYNECSRSGTSSSINRRKASSADQPGIAALAHRFSPTIESGHRVVPRFGRVQGFAAKRSSYSALAADLAQSSIPSTVKVHSSCSSNSPARRSPCSGRAVSIVTVPPRSGWPAS